MNVDEVAAELGAALDTIPDLNVPEWGVQRVSPPFAVVPLPERVDYDDTYQRGTDRIEDWPVMVLVPHPTKPEARRAIAPYADGSGAQSVKAAVEAYAFTACTTPRVEWSEFDVVSFAGTDYLAAIFHLNIKGPGS